MNLHPSLREGFARSAKESASPKLWKGLEFASFPSLGITGNKIWDYSHRQNNGTNNGATWKGSKIGSTLDFNGTSNFVDYGDITVLDGLSEMTISSWFQMDTWDGKLQAIFGKDALGEGDGGAYELHFDDRGGAGTTNALSYIMRGSTGALIANSDNNIVPDTGWHNAVGTYNNRSDFMRLYYDGKEIDSNTGVGTIRNSTAILEAGKSSHSGNFYFDGGINNMLLYRRAWTPSEVLFRYINRMAMFQLKRPIGKAPAAILAANTRRRKMAMQGLYLN